MKIKNKNRIIVLIALISMLLMVIPANNVLALSVTHSINFETCIALSPVTYAQTTYLMTKKKSGFVNASASVPKTGFTDLGIYSINSLAGSGWINLSYSKSLYLTSFRLWLRTTFSVASTEFYMIMYNKTTQWAQLSSALLPNTTNGILTFMACYSGTGLAHAISGNYVIGTNKLWSIYNQINISITDNLGHGTLWRNNSAPVTFTCSNASTVNNNCRIDSIYFYATDWHAVNYIDDMNLTLSDSYAGGGVSGCLVTTGLTQVGHFGYCAGDIQTSHVYKKYNIPVTTTVSGIELQVSPDQFSDDQDLTHYELSINGLNIGNPICFNPESYYYVLQWDTSYAVTNDLLTFDFYHSQKTVNRYWAIGESCSSTDDLDADGDISYQYTDYTVSYEWRWILFIPFHVPVSTPYTLTRNRDLSMRWWCSGFPTQETYNYIDTLGLSNYNSHNSTGYIYNVSLGNILILGSYTLGNPALTYTLELYKDGTQLYQYGFPMSCRYPGGSFGFTPTFTVSLIGKYYIRLRATTYRGNVTAWVTGVFPPYMIVTNPSVTDQYQSYIVSYWYYNTQGNDGGIAMDIVPTMLNTYSETIYQRNPILVNTTNSFLYSTNSSNAEYWGLYAYANNLYSKIADATHFIRIPSIFDNDIHPLLPNLVITGNNENNAGMMLQGTHIFPGSRVSVYVNGIFLRYVGDSQYFTVSYVPTKIGTFNATLVLFQNNSQVLLDYCSFTVSSSDTEPVPGGGGLGFDIHDFIPPPYDLFVCIGFIIFMVMLPSIIIVSLQKKIPAVQLHIPDLVVTFASIACGFCGFILTVMWGLLSWVWFFAFTFTLIVILALLYYSGHKSGGGGNATQ